LEEFVKVEGEDSGGLSDDIDDNEEEEQKLQSPMPIENA